MFVKHCVGFPHLSTERLLNVIFKKYKTFSVLIYSYINLWKLEKREILWKHDARRAECFHTISSFSNFHEC